MKLSTWMLVVLMGWPVPGQAGKKGAAKDKKLTASVVLDRIQEFYESTEDYQATFKQVYKNKLYNETKKSSGKVYIKRPGKMRWEYKKPTEKLFVSDGKTLWVYEAEANQVYKQDLSSSDLPTAISFLMGKGDLKEDFKYKLVKNEKAKKKGLLVVELVPKKATTQYKKLLFMVDDETFRVKRTIIVDHTGNTNSMRFEKVKTNQGVSSKKFKFKMPKGATLVKP
jgi:outer membrane lipoprotein carrier protein